MQQIHYMQELLHKVENKLVNISYSTSIFHKVEFFYLIKIPPLGLPRLIAITDHSPFLLEKISFVPLSAQVQLDNSTVLAPITKGIRKM